MTAVQSEICKANLVSVFGVADMDGMIFAENIFVM